MAANYSTWGKVWSETFAILRRFIPSDIFLEYSTCTTDSDIIQDIIRSVLYYEQRGHGHPQFGYKRNKNFAKIILLITAKHAKNDTVLQFIFERLTAFDFHMEK